MLRLATESSPAPQPPQPGGKWINLKTAAARSGWNEGHIRRLCFTQWMSANLAEQRTPPEGGKPTWFIREDADPKFAAVKSPEQLSREVDLRQYTQKQRDAILLRERVALAFDQAMGAATKLGMNKTTAAEQFLLRLAVDEKLNVSRATLYNWHKGWRQSGRAGLLDGRTAAAEKQAEDHSDFFAYFRDLYLTPRKLSLRICYLMSQQKAMESGWSCPSESTTKRHVKSLPKQLIVKKREGDDAYVAKCEPYIPRDYSTLTTNEMWCGDDQQSDVFVLHQGKFIRPRMSAWQDMRSRRIVGWSIYAGDGNIYTVLRAFINGAVECGIPGKVYVDNGKIYDARALQGRTKQQRKDGIEADVKATDGAFQILQVTVTHVWPYHGQSKPIERFFGTVRSQFDKLFETYCGSDNKEKPENLQQQLAAGKAPTLEEYAAGFGEWVTATYNANPHTGDSMDGRSPQTVFDACLNEKRTLPREILEFACLPRVGPVKVGRQGVTWKGMHFGAFSPKIQALLGEKVNLALDESNLNRVLVVMPDGRFVCEAMQNKKLPANATREDLSAAIAEKKQNRKALKEYNQRRMRIGDDLHALAARSAARRQAEQAAAPTDPAPPTLKPQITAFDGQLREIAAAMNPVKLAVGAESFNPQTLQSAIKMNMPAAADADEPDTFSILSSAMGKGGNR